MLLTEISQGDAEGLIGFIQCIAAVIQRGASRFQGLQGQAAVGDFSLVVKTGMGGEGLGGSIVIDAGVGYSSLKGSQSGFQWGDVQALFLQTGDQIFEAGYPLGDAVKACGLNGEPLLLAGIGAIQPSVTVCTRAISRC